MLSPYLQGYPKVASRLPPRQNLLDPIFDHHQARLRRAPRIEDWAVGVAEKVWRLSPSLARDPDPERQWLVEVAFPRKQSS